MLPHIGYIIMANGDVLNLAGVVHDYDEDVVGYVATDGLFTTDDQVAFESSTEPTKWAFITALGDELGHDAYQRWIRRS